MKETILIVDDDTSILDIYRQGLLRKGFNVLTASSGEQAMEILKKSPADVLITDISMPGMDGKDLLSSSMNLYPEMSTAIITAYGTLSLAVDTWRHILWNRLVSSSATLSLAFRIVDSYSLSSGVKNRSPPTRVCFLIK